MSTSAAPPRGMSWKLADHGQGEGQARLVETDGQRAVVESTLPFAAGATLIGVDLTTGSEYRIKVRGGRRIDDTWFRIEGRFVSLTKAERDVVLAAFAEPKP
jgi:hypothetical protein